VPDASVLGFSSWTQVAASRGYKVTGPVVVGGVGFFTAVLDRLQQSKDRFIYNDQPLYLELTVPAGVALAFVMGIIEYHPPSYQIRFLLPGTPIYAGTAGSITKLGPYPRGSNDPEGKYAWRIGMMALVCDAYGCRWYWGQHVQYYDFTISQVCPAVCPAGQQCDPATGTCVPKLPCTAPCTHLDPNTNTCVSTCTPGQQCDAASNQCIITCSPGMQRDPLTNTCVSVCPADAQWNPDTKSCQTWLDRYMAWLISGVVVALVAIGILAVFLLTRKKPAPSPGYKPYYPTAPAAPALKPGGPQAVKPAAHRPMVIARREEEKK
jgi:hypothetical protein